MKNTNTRKAASTTATAKASVIKLGLDVHADSVSVVRQIEGTTPQPAQKFTWARFWKWAARQTGLADQVYSCYEAGPFGFGTHRRLIELGITNIVVHPEDWDSRHKRVKTDRVDALALVQRLSLYVQGNERVFTKVCIPTPEQEQLRSETRLRDQMRRHRQRAEAQGRSMLLYYGVRVKGRWWSPRRWEEIAGQVGEAIRELLEPFRVLARTADEQVRRLTARIEARAPKQAPKGYGRLTLEVLGREIVDWHRFENRRQVASLTGLCPGVNGSGNRLDRGSISKHGNPRIRQAAVEAAWRACRFQPQYWAVQRWQAQLKGPSAAARKKAVVAIARHLVIDLWRMNTGRATAQQLGLSVLCEAESTPAETGNHGSPNPSSGGNMRPSAQATLKPMIR